MGWSTKRRGKEDPYFSSWNASRSTWCLLESWGGKLTTGSSDLGRWFQVPVVHYLAGRFMICEMLFAVHVRLDHCLIGPIKLRKRLGLQPIRLLPYFQFYSIKAQVPKHASPSAKKKKKKILETDNNNNNNNEQPCLGRYKVIADWNEFNIRSQSMHIFASNSCLKDCLATLIET